MNNKGRKFEDSPTSRQRIRVGVAALLRGSRKFASKAQKAKRRHPKHRGNRYGDNW